MKTFLYFTGLITAVFGVAYGTSMLIVMGWHSGLCYSLYLTALALIGWVAHLVNANFMEYDDDYISSGYDGSEWTHRLTK